MICSKTLTLGKTDLIGRFAQSDFNICNTANTEFFNIGYPISDPPRLRGSIVAILSSDFIKSNQDFIVFGSPIDTGGIRFGFFDNCDDIEKTISESTCDGEKFLALLNELFHTLSPKALQKLYRHELSIEIMELLKRFFSSRVVSFIENNQTNPHSLLFEFSLASSYSLLKEHINRLFIPNTIDSFIKFPYLHSEISNKIYYFNPKYGIEHVVDIK